MGRRIPRRRNGMNKRKKHEMLGTEWEEKKKK
jgi:hypothetical protein